jgi:hypothetical protein
MGRIYIFLLFVFVFSLRVVGAVIFTETMGTVSGTTAIAAHESADGFDNNPYTMTAGGAVNAADVRATSVSTGYSGASGGANIFFTNTSGERGFAIEGIDASGYTNLVLSFAVRKENAAGTDFATFLLDYWDGSVYQPITLSGLPTSSNGTGWYLITGISLPAGAQINGLRLRFRKTGTIACRLDDVKLEGNSTASITTTAASYGPFCNTSAHNISVAYTSSGSFSGTFKAQISNASGVFPNNASDNIIGTGTSPITATIPVAQAAGTGYRVRVVNDNPVTLSGNDNGSNFIIYSPVNISSHPADAVVVENNAVSFSVVASGASGYQWQVNDGTGWVDVSNGGSYSGATTATLNLSNVPVSLNAHLYRCVVSSNSPCTTSTSNSAILTVNVVCVSDASGYTGWSISGAAVSSAQACTGNGILFTGNGQYAITPGVINPLRLNFNKKRSTNTDAWSMKVQVSTSASGPWTDVQTVSTITNTCLAHPQIDLSSYIGLHYFRFIDTRSSGAVQRGIDDIVIICKAPCTAIPTVSSSLSAFSNVNAESFTVNFSPGNGNKRLVVLKQSAAVSGTPVNGTTYMASSVFGDGDELSAGEYVVYYGFGNSVTVTGLDRNATYHVAIFESCDEEYKAVDPATGSQSTTNALITVSVPDEMEYVFGSGPSTPQTFTVSGSNLVPAAGNIVVTAPTNFQVATAIGGPYSNSLNLPFTGNALSTNTVYARLNSGLNVGVYSGSAVVSGGTAVMQSVAFVGKVVPGSCEDLFFSEYVEGANNNKLLEIYNPTASSISLSNYLVRVYSNGSSTPTTTTTLSGTIAAYSTFIIANPGETWSGTPNQTSTNMNFNGDDAVELYRVGIETTLDIIGRIGEQPDDGGWFSGSHSTLNKTLVRKPTVTYGVRTNPVSGFPTLESEWILYEVNEFAMLGSHLSVCQNTNIVFIENIAPLPLCNGSEIVLQFAATGTYGAGNIFEAELSNASGSFASATPIGSSGVLTGTNISGNINATIPPSTSAGSGYKIRITASNPNTAVSMLSVAMPVVFAPENVTAASATPVGTGQISISWMNPNSCFDEIVIFMSEEEPVSITPSGNGSSYVPTVADGCGVSTNTVVYKGTGGNIVVPELTNGTEYHIKIFTRYGTSWSSGVAVTVIPGQNMIEPGDLLILAVNTSDDCGIASEVDVVYMVSFRDINPGTTLDVTDNGWERQNSGKWGGTEGFYRITYNGASAIAKGTVFQLFFHGGFDIDDTQVLNPDWDIVKFGTGSINLSVNGDQLFFLQAGSWENTVPSAHNATYTGGRIIYAFNSNPAWVALDGNSNQSGLPETARCVDHLPLTAADRYFAYTGATSAADRVVWLQRLRNAANWTTYGTCAAFSTYMSGFPTSITINADAAASVLWTGTQSTNWFDCYNWESRVIPNNSLNASIPNTANKPRINAAAGYASLYNGKAATANLSIQSGGRLDMNGSADHYLEVNGNLTINAGGQLNMNDGNAGTADGTLVIRGNWTNNAETGSFTGFDEGQSTVKLMGSGTQTISINGSYTEAFYNLVIQKPAQEAVVLSRPVSIAATGQMEFKCGGYLNANGHTVTLLNPDPDNALIGYEPPNDSGVYENDRYIFGELIRQVDREAEYIFPIGDALNGERYNPVNLNITSADPGSGQVSGRFIPGNPGTISDIHIFYCSYSSTRKFHEYAGMTGEGWWRFTGPDYGYDITLYPNIVNVNTFPNDSLLQYRDNYRAIKAATGTGGGTWPSSAARAGDLCVVGGYYAVPGAGYTGFSDFGVPGGNGNTTALPIELMLFRARAVDNHKVMTEWVTASERNNDYFTVERSKNAVQFEAIGVVAGAGNSIEALFYDFEDTSPYTGISYYRLKQTDFDGNFSYSRIEQVFIAPSGTISVYPNPANEYLTVELPVSVYPYKLQLFDLMGREVYGNSTSGIQLYRLSMDHIPSGMYLLQVSDGNTKTYFKVLRQ